MVRWLADGRLDPSFGTGGYLSLPGLLEPRAAAVDSRDGSTLILTRSGSDLAIAVQLWRIPP